MNVLLSPDRFTLSRSTLDGTVHAAEYLVAAVVIDASDATRAVAERAATWPDGFSVDEYTGRAQRGRRPPVEAVLHHHQIAFR